MKVYIAAPFFNFEQTEQVIAVENLLDKHAVQYFSPRSFGKIIKDMTQEEKEKNMELIYEKNVKGILECDVMIVLLDHKDTGTTWELGFASGYNKIAHSAYHTIKIITVSLQNKPVNVMLRYCIDAHATTEKELEFIINTLLLKGALEYFTSRPEVNE